MPVARAVADLVVAAGARVQRPLVERHVQDVGVRVEDLLRAVAVVRVDSRRSAPARPRSASSAAATATLFSRQKPIALRRARVVTGRPEREERARRRAPVASASTAARPAPAAVSAARHEPAETRCRRRSARRRARLSPRARRGTAPGAPARAPPRVASRRASGTRSRRRGPAGSMPGLDRLQPRRPLGVARGRCRARRERPGRWRRRSTRERYTQPRNFAGSHRRYASPANDPTTTCAGPAAGPGSAPGGAAPTWRTSPSGPTARRPPRSWTAACGRCAGAATPRSSRAPSPPAEALPFVDAGFSVHERLHLLAHDLGDIPAAEHATRRARKGRPRRGARRSTTAPSDRFWRLDRDGLEQGDRRHAGEPVPRRRGRRRPARRTRSPVAPTGTATCSGSASTRTRRARRLRALGRARRVCGGCAVTAPRRRSSTPSSTTSPRSRSTESCGFRELPSGLCVMGRAL